MSEAMDKVRSYLLDLEVLIVGEDAEDEIFIVSDEDNGIHNLLIDCEAPILVLEQYIMPISGEPTQLFKRLLQMNQLLVHGAFALDDSGEKLYFRDTLQLENLDANELEASIDALALALAEFGSELLDFAKAA